LSNVYKNRIKSQFLAAIKADLELEDAGLADSVLEDVSPADSVLKETNGGT